jgi:hypothetical protein
MLTKIGNDVTTPGWKNAWNNTAGMRGKLWKAESYGVGPMGLALSASAVHSGDRSVGGAVGGSVAGGLVGVKIDKVLSPRIAKGTSAIAAKLSNAGAVGKLLGRLPGPVGKAVGLGASIYGAMKADSTVGALGDKYAPIWKRKKQLPNGMGVTPEQLQQLRSVSMAMSRGGISPESLHNGLSATGMINN